MKYLCCVPNCPYKIGYRSKLYFLPNPVKNKALFDKWMQTIGGGLDDLEDLYVYTNRFICERHFLDLSSKNPTLFRKEVSDVKVNEGVKEFKTIDDEVKSVVVRKCTLEKPKVVRTSSPPIFILQNHKVDGKEKPALLVLQKINRDQNSKDETQPTTTIECDPLECLLEDQEVIVNTTETIDVHKNNDTNTKKLKYEVIQKDSPCITVETVDLTKTHDTNTKKIGCERIAKNVNKSVVNPLSEKVCFPPVKRQPTILKRTGLAVPVKPSERSGDTTGIVKPTIAKHTSMALKQCVYTPTANKITLKRQPSLTDVASNTNKLDNIQMSHIKSTGNEFNFAVRVQDETNLPPEINEVVSEVEISDAGGAELDVTEMDVAEVEISESEVFDDKAPRVPQFKLNATSGVGAKQATVTLDHRRSVETQANFRDRQASTVPRASEDQRRIVKTYLKKSSLTSDDRPPPVFIPQEKPIPWDEWRALISGLVANKPRAKNITIRPATKASVNKDAIVSDVYNSATPDPILTNPIKQGTFRVITEAMHSRLSQTSVPLFTGPVDRWYMVPDEFNKFIETIKDTPIVQKNLSDTIDAANINRLPHVEAERMKSLIKCYHEHFQKFKTVINILEKQLKKHKATIIRLKKKISAARVDTKSKAFEKITRDMTEDAKMIIRMQVVNHKKKPRARRFSLKEKLFSLALYKLSRQAYRYVSSILAIPTINTLNVFLNALHTQLLAKDGAATDNNSQENDETVAAVAVISGDSVTENLNGGVETENRQNYSNTEEMEDSANQITFPADEPYTDAGYIETDCADFDNYVHEMEFATQYVQGTNDHTSEVIVIPSNYETIYFEHSGIQEHQFSLPVNPDTPSQKKVNIPKNNKITAASNKSLKQSKSKIYYVPTLTDEKKEKIDFILSKMMTPDQLKNLVLRSRKKVVKKRTDEVKNKNKKPKDPKGAITGITKRILKVNKDNNVTETITHKRNIKKNAPLSHHAQTNTGFIDHSYAPESITDPNQVVLGTIKKHNKQIQQNIVRHPQHKVRVMDHIPETPLTSVQVITNEDNNEINVLDTVTKLRRKLEKYSPNTIQDNTSFIEASYMSQRTLGSEQIIKNIDKSKVSIHNTMRRRYVSHLEKEPIKRKRKKRLVRDESQLSYDPPNTCSTPNVFVLDSEDVRLPNLAISRNVNISQHENSPPYETEQSVRVAPELIQHFSNTNRKIFSFKRLPTQPY